MNESSSAFLDKQTFTLYRVTPLFTWVLQLTSDILNTYGIIFARYESKPLTNSLPASRQMAMSGTKSVYTQRSQNTRPESAISRCRGHRVNCGLCPTCIGLISHKVMRCCFYESKICILYLISLCDIEIVLLHVIVQNRVQHFILWIIKEHL